jgi:hypothetical protein
VAPDPTATAPAEPCAALTAVSTAISGNSRDRRRRATTRHINLGIILSATTYEYLGQVSWYGHLPAVWNKQGGSWQPSADFVEQIILARSLVSGPGVLP